MGYNLVDYSPDRTNGQLTLQYDVTDTLRATVDYTYSKYEITARGNDVWAFGSTIMARPVFGHRKAIRVPSFPIAKIGQRQPENPTDLSMGASLTANQNENTSVGLNLAWDPSDKLSLEFDFDSSA